MIKNFFLRSISLWVRWVERRAWGVLALLALLTALGAGYAVTHFSINSDLDRLVKPRKPIEWYGYDRAYRATFPQYQQFALVVVSSDSAEDSFRSAERLYRALQQSGKFDDVFSPLFEEFTEKHVLYGASTEVVKRVSARVGENLPVLGDLYHEPTIPHYLAYLDTLLAESRESGVLLPEAKQALKVYTQALQSLEQDSGAAGSFPDLSLVRTFAPEDEEGTSYQFIMVKKNQDFSVKLPNALTMQDIHKVIAHTEMEPGVLARVTGEVALANDEIGAGLSGIEISGAMSLLLLLVVLYFGIRSWRVIIGIFLMLFMGIIFTICFSLFFIGSFNTLSMVFLVMFFGLGVDYAVHFCLRAVEANQESGVEGHAGATTGSPAVVAAEGMGDAMALCVATSAAAFLAFLPTDYIGLAEMGIISAGGLFIAYLVTLTFFPAWFKVFGYRVLVFDNLPLLPGFFRYLAKVNPARVVFVSLLLFLGSAWYARDVGFNYSHLAMRDKDSEAMSTLLELQKNQLGTEYSIAIIAPPGTDLAALKARLLEKPTVSRVNLPSEYIPAFQDAKQEYMRPLSEKLQALGVSQDVAGVDRESTGLALAGFVSRLEADQELFLDEDQKLVSGALLSSRKLQGSPGSWEVVQRGVASGVRSDVEKLRNWFGATPFTLQDLPPSMRDRLVAPDGSQLVLVVPSVDMTDLALIERFILDVKSVAPNYTGRAVIEWGVAKVVLDAFQQAALISLVAIFILLLMHFRNVAISLLVFIPLVLASALTFAVMKFLGISFNMANILVVPLIFGLGVDTGIHVAHRYRHSASMEEMMLSGTTRAAVISALTTMFTFISLAFSPHKGAASIGLLLAIAIGLLLLTTYTILPALLHVFEPKKG